VLRPRGLPALTHGAADLQPVGHWPSEDETPPPQLTDITLVLADLDPAVGADHLTAWSDRVVVVLTAGKSGAEKVRSIADVIRAAGLDLRFGLLMHTERTDNSTGILNLERPAPMQQWNGHERVESASKSEVR
jgi:hypothetical protein